LLKQPTVHAFSLALGNAGKSSARQDRNDRNHHHSSMSVKAKARSRKALASGMVVPLPALSTLVE